jgi:Subtilase family
MDASVHVDLVRDEILTRRPTVEVDVPANADPDLVRRAVGVLGADGSVRPTRRKGRYRWTAGDELAPGRHVLVVEPLADGRSRRLTDAVEIPFLVVATRAELPGRVRVESFTRVRLGSDGPVRLPTGTLPRGDYLDFVKATDRRSGEPVALAFDQDGREVDGEALLEEHLTGLAAKRGKVHPTLEAAGREAPKSRKITVDAWISVEEDEPTAADRPHSDCDIELAVRRAGALRQVVREQAERLATALGERYEVVRVDELAPVVTLRVEASAVRELASRADVAALFLHEEEGIDDLGDSIDVARSDVVHAAGETGSGVRVAVWENGPTSTAELVIAGRYTTSPSTSDHSQNVHAIVRNTESDAPNGHAPGVSLYSANSKNRAALTWAVDSRDCTVVNQSFHRDSEPGSAVLSGDDLYGDWLALHWPYPLIVHAAGNFWDGDPDGIDPPSSEYVNHKGFNTISVGNHNDTAAAMSSTSVFRNPSSPHGDRELPEISANGVSVTATGIMMSGTSQASPAVAGAAALIQGTSATLEHWPEGCRAILFASASRNVRGGTWWQDVSAGVDARDGAGALDAAEARTIALNRRWRNAPGTRRGWDVGLLSSADIGSGGMSTFDYKVTVPRTFFGPRNVKVALAWTSKVARLLGIIYTSSLTVDLDLKVFDESGSQVGYSGSWDNSYEIAEFIGRPGATYTIRIRRWSGTGSTWYGLAWTVTGGLQLTVPLDELVIGRTLLGG